MIKHEVGDEEEEKRERFQHRKTPALVLAQFSSPAQRDCINATVRVSLEQEQY